MNDTTTPQIERLIRIEEVEHMTGLRRVAIYRLISRGDFPKQVKVSPRAVAWFLDDIQQWIRTKKAAS